MTPDALKHKSIHGYKIVKASEAWAVYDQDAKEVFAHAPGLYWSLPKSKALRERATGHRCHYIGLWHNSGAEVSHATD